MDSLSDCSMDGDTAGVRKTPALAPEYQCDNLYMKLIGPFYKSEEIAYFLQFIRSRLRA